MDTVRTFIAIELPEPILARLEELQARMREDVPPGLLRWVRPAGIHLTLKFLGEVPLTQIEVLSGALQEACAPHGGFAFRIAGLGCFPNPRRPRVVWVGVEEPSGALARLQRDVERALSPLGYPPEGRPYSPHLTLGRVKGHGREALEALGAYVSRSAVTVGQVQASAVHLMRSDLRPSGAVYTELAVAPLMGH
jgi:2'-5' RNA ligase